MELFALNQEAAKKNRNHAAQQKETIMRRKWAANAEMAFERAGNQAALLPRDAYRELDDMTMRVIRNDEGSVYMNALRPLAKAIPIGKTLSQYRVSTDKDGGTTRSMAGQVPEQLGKVTYDYEGDPIGIFVNGTVLEWREYAAFTTEAIDVMADNQEARTRELMQNVAQYMLDGDSAFRVNGFVGQGIRNHRHTQQVELGAAGANIDLTSTATSADDIFNFYIQYFGNILNENFIVQPLKHFVSPDIMLRLNLPYSGSGGFKEGTLLQRILQEVPRIESIEQTFELSGNEFFAFVPDQKYICPLVGMAMSTFQEPRIRPFDNHMIINYAAYGLRITEDANGRGGVYYASAS